MSSTFNENILRELRHLSAGDWLGIALPVAIIAFVIKKTVLDYDRRARLDPKKERVFVVGASSGIGRQIALDYSARGATVAVMGRRQSELEAVRDACTSAGATKVVAVVGDFSDVAGISRARDQIQSGQLGMTLCVRVLGYTDEPIDGASMRRFHLRFDTFRARWP